MCVCERSLVVVRKDPRGCTCKKALMIQNMHKHYKRWRQKKALSVISSRNRFERGCPHLNHDYFKKQSLS